MPNPAKFNGTAPLTARQATFCRLLAEGRSGRDAYLRAGYQVAPEIADASASRLLGMPSGCNGEVLAGASGRESVGDR